MRIRLLPQKIIVGIVIIAVLVLASVPAIYYYQKYQSLKTQTVTGANKDEVAELVANVARHILLPDNEMPTVMTVTDKEKISGQAFFVNSKNGDKVLVYTTAKKAFLYDPVADKILEVGPVQENQATENTQSTPSPAAVPVRFYLLNGTTVVGLTKRYEPVLKAAVPGAVVVDRDNAARQDYGTSLFVDVSGSASAQAQELGKALGVSVGSLPAGETRPEGVDFLIILGNDKK